MRQGKIKRISGILLVCIGAIALIIEIASVTKNYYLQSIGVICLMSGLFLVNTTLTSRSRAEHEIHIEEEEE